jgi:hypothetical protein
MLGHMEEHMKSGGHRKQMRFAQQGQNLLISHLLLFME